LPEKQFSSVHNFLFFRPGLRLAIVPGRKLYFPTVKDQLISAGERKIMFNSVGDSISVEKTVVFQCPGSRKIDLAKTTEFEQRIVQNWDYYWNQAKECNITTISQFIID
jgi:hypothetical protein